MKLKKKQFTETGLKWLFAMAFLLLVLFQLKGRWRDLSNLNYSFYLAHLDTFIIVFVLMLIGLLLEAYKWRLTLHHAYDISLPKALSSTLGGNSLSILTPNRLGEFAGRILFLPAEHRGRGAVLTLIGSYSQALCTIIAGTWALAIYAIYQIEMPTVLDVASVVICIAVTLILLTSYFNVSLIVPIIGQIKFLRRFQQPVSVLNVLPVKTLAKIMTLSAIKYIVFNIQYILLLKMHGNLFDISQLFYQLPLIFFIQTAIPSFAISEVGMRASVALFILQATGSMVAPVIISAALLWFINLILPSIAGGIIVLRHKFITI